MQPEQAAVLDAQKLYIPSGAVLSEGRCMRRWEVLWAVYNGAFAFFKHIEEKAQRQAQLDRLTGMVGSCFIDLSRDFVCWRNCPVTQKIWK